jgi:GntR family transcriptional regulator
LKTPVERVGGGSLASRARAAILEAIVENRFEAGRIPPEGDLAEMLGVSRTTVRAALQVLEHDGVIARAPGRGTTILPADPFAFSLQRLIGFSTLLRESGIEPEVEVKWEKSDSPPLEAAQRLGIGASDNCYISRKIFRADARVVLVLRDVVPERSLRRPIPLGESLPDSLFDFSAEFCDEPIESARVELVPHMAGAEIASLFEIDEGAPYLMLLETHLSRNYPTLAFTKVHVNDQFIRFFVTRRH